MKNPRLILAPSLLLVGCATVESSLNYTKGTEALEAGDTDAAISHLEKAVQLDPGLARNHNNLAAAYFAKNRIREGWPHVRKAVGIAPRDEFARQNFVRYFLKLVDMGLIKEGLTEQQVVRNLGTPDSKQESEGRTAWQYGLTAFYFEKGRLTGFNNMIYR
jgi:tetratricopeptide (TPR) repeat protein